MKTMKEFKDKYINDPDIKKLTQKVIKNTNPKWIIPNKNEILIADVLYLPEDEQGYKYTLVACDGKSRHVDAEPMKDLTSNTTLAAMKIILKRKILKLPNYKIITDGGNEFKGKFEEYLNKNKIMHQKTKSGRHSQTIIIDSFTYLIGKYLNLAFVQQEIEYKRKKQSNNRAKLTYKWRPLLTQLIKIFNTNKYIQNEMNDDEIKKIIDEGIQTTKYNRVILPIGTEVRITLDYPIDYVSGKRLQGKFRASDLRFTHEYYKVHNIVLNSGQPPMYILEDKNKKVINNVVYTRQQLQPK